MFKYVSHRDDKSPRWATDPSVRPLRWWWWWWMCAVAGEAAPGWTRVDGLHHTACCSPAVGPCCCCCCCCCGAACWRRRSRVFSSAWPLDSATATGCRRWRAAFCCAAFWESGATEKKKEKQLSLREYKQNNCIPRPMKTCFFPPFGQIQFVECVLKEQWVLKKWQKLQRFFLLSVMYF